MWKCWVICDNKWYNIVISTNHFPPGSFRCGQNCATCPYITNGLTSYTFYATGETRSITSHITCNTKNVIYMVQCNRCNLQYIGETNRVVLFPFPNIDISVYLQMDTILQFALGRTQRDKSSKKCGKNCNVMKAYCHGERLLVVLRAHSGCISDQTV